MSNGVRGTKETTEIENQPIHQADQSPEPALFSLEYLYLIQDPQDRWEHAHYVRSQLERSREIIRLCDLELRHRTYGIEDKPEDLQPFSEVVADSEDNVIRLLRGFHEDDILEYRAHIKLATASQRSLARAAMRAGDLTHKETNQ